MSTTLTATELAARHHRRAVRFFWTWLTLATLASLAGIITHALLTAQTGSKWLAAAVAMVPPAVLLAAVHGIAVLAKVNASGAVYRAAVGATAAHKRNELERFSHFVTDWELREYAYHL